MSSIIRNNVTRTYQKHHFHWCGSLICPEKFIFSWEVHYLFLPKTTRKLLYLKGKSEQIHILYWIPQAEAYFRFSSVCLFPRFTQKKKVNFWIQSQMTHFQQTYLKVSLIKWSGRDLGKHAIWKPIHNPSYITIIGLFCLLNGCGILQASWNAFSHFNRHECSVSCWCVNTSPTGLHAGAGSIHVIRACVLLH